MKLYFAYGANLNLRDMSHRCPKAIPVKPFYLRDYQLSFSGVATITPAAGFYVPGALWRLTDECEQNLDIFEGAPMLYRKETMTQDDQEFMAYVMNHGYPSRPGQGYFNTIAQGYKDWGLNTGALIDAVCRVVKEEAATQTTSIWQYQSLDQIADLLDTY